MGILSRAPSFLKFILAEKRAQFLVLPLPSLITMVERLRQPTPSNIFDQYCLFCWYSCPLLLTQSLQ
ncbi:hypothetical protein PsgB076_27505 [Pseudomonas savastanoi pv. glycinea str. B076]|nr:hypothetical protein PsgB076_27505 [Pseudomonas savastanoi pv. glycinea str. B076]